jgi:energy-coupling factor transporter ATP-binding protein EcfA2
MNNATLYALSINQTFNAILHGAMDTTVLVQGHMGSGKSSLLKMLAKALPTHHACYFDCTTKDLGDIQIPKLKDLNGNDYVRFATHEELGLHLENTPIILMIDEYGKANPSVKNALLALMQERKMGSRTLHPDSLIFATTNLGAEGVGDVLLPHARNRITIINMRKPDNMEFIEWGIENRIDPIIMGWARQNPQAFQSFEQIENPDDNAYIYHPRSARTSFVTGRSLEKASNWVKKRNVLDNATVTASLIGTVGDTAALDMATFMAMADKLPTLESIKKSPDQAMVPDNVAALCMVVYKVLQVIEYDWVGAWMDYMKRIPAEAQSLFINGVRSPSYSPAKQKAVMNHQKFTEYAHSHAYLFGRDQ